MKKSLIALIVTAMVILTLCGCGIMNKITKSFDTQLYKAIQSSEYITIETSNAVAGYRLIAVEDNSTTSGQLSENWTVIVDPGAFETPSFSCIENNGKYTLTISGRDTYLYRQKQ